MSIDVKQLKLFVIVPTLAKLGLYSEAAVNLLLGTCAQESAMGTYLKQINGPALGIYQMEPNTHDDICDNFLKYRPELAGKVLGIDSCQSANLMNNLAYATAMARIQYLRAPAELPDANDTPELGRYWKLFYNSQNGKGCIDEFVANYARYVNV
jgi:hypothetical protein